MRPVMLALISGIAVGSVYAIVALGLQVSYSGTGVFNLAQGQLLMGGIMLSYVFMEVWSLPPWLAGILCTLSIAMVSIIEERTIVRPFLNRVAESFGWVIAIIGFTLLIQAIAIDQWGARPVARIRPAISTIFEVDNVPITAQEILTFGILTALVSGSMLYYRRTSYGTAMRGTSEDRVLASLRGIRPGVMSALSFGLGGAAAGLGGFLVGSISFADPTVGLSFTIKAFIALAIGGFDSTGGAVAGGLLLGIAEQMSDRFIAPEYEVAVGLVLLLAVLSIKPTGIFGPPAERTV
jgi:branched-chain amino acid transport system permease protein